MNVYFDLWKVAEHLRIRDEYILERETDECKKDELKKSIESCAREAEECKEKHIYSTPLRFREWERKRISDEWSNIRIAAIEEAEEILKGANEEIM